MKPRFSLLLAAIAAFLPDAHAQKAPDDEIATDVTVAVRAPLYLQSGLDLAPDTRCVSTRAIPAGPAARAAMTGNVRKDRFYASDHRWVDLATFRRDFEAAREPEFRRSWPGLYAGLPATRVDLLIRIHEEFEKLIKEVPGIELPVAYELKFVFAGGLTLTCTSQRGASQKDPTHWVSMLSALEGRGLKLVW